MTAVGTGKKLDLGTRLRLICVFKRLALRCDLLQGPGTASLQERSRTSDVKDYCRDPLRTLMSDSEEVHGHRLDVIAESVPFSVYGFPPGSGDQ